MAEDVRLWRVNEQDELQDIASAKLALEQRLESWITNDISILSEDLLLIGRQVATAYGGSVDLLGIDENGDLTIIELKRDRTPRAVVAQALDYASWVQELSREDVVKIADGFLRAEGALEREFSRKFDSPLPESLNENHSILIVGSAIDDSSERIVRYLSDSHGVGVNVATFTFFRDEAMGAEYLARVFLIEPEQVEQRQESKGTSKRRPKPSFERFEEIARDNGVFELFDRAARSLSTSMRMKRVQRSVGFVAKLPRGWRTMINLIPGESSKDDGLRFEIYEHPVRDAFDLDEPAFLAMLPRSHEPWVYATGHADYTGYTGWIQTEEEVDRLAAALRKS